MEDRLTHTDAYDTPARRQRIIGYWLLLCCVMVTLMVVIGGLTRLTGSGLSMTDWHPIHGIIPPLTTDAWQEEFASYQQSPEYQKINFGMGLSEFKQIFMVEYIHRIAGRVTGFVFLLPFAYFGVRRWLGWKLALKLTGIFALGGMQGVLGWYMVKSGLVDDPRVSPYRLTAHLAMAFFIFALLLWTALGRLAPRDSAPAMAAGTHALPVGAGLIRWGWMTFALLVLQILMGGFVAGLDAGMVYNSFPTMNGQWVPDGLLLLEPLWRNVFENVTAVQFIHRWVAFAVAGALVVLWWRTRPLWGDAWLKLACDLTIIALIVQLSLGVAALLHAVPVSLGSLHQTTALLLFAALLSSLYRLQMHYRARQEEPGVLGEESKSG